MDDGNAATAGAKRGVYARLLKAEYKRILADSEWKRRLDAAIALYANGRVSMGFASENAEVSILVMAYALRKAGVPIRYGRSGPRSSIGIKRRRKT